MARKVLMLGLDALVPNILEKFVGEGILPNFSRLFQEGCFTRLLSAIPAQTPANWHTLATGATPGTHSVTVWGAHRPTDPIPECHRDEAFNSGLCLAEYVWERAARAGKRSVVMNYAGYPPTTDHALHIDRLYQPVRSYYDIAPPTVYHNLAAEAGEGIELRQAKGWSNLPESALSPLSAEIHVPPASPGEGPSYHVLLSAEGEGYDTLMICESKDARAPLVRLSPGEWSDWIKAIFNTEEMGEACPEPCRGVEGAVPLVPSEAEGSEACPEPCRGVEGPVRLVPSEAEGSEACPEPCRGVEGPVPSAVEGAFRFKLVECSSDGKRLRLYRSEAFPTDGRFCSDADFGRRLIEKLGPYIHAMATAQLHVVDGILDWQTADEALADEAVWWSEAARMAMDETGAELLYLHWHFPDLVGHTLVPRIDPEGTAYAPEKAEESWRLMRDYYRAMDRFVGEFLDRFSLDENVIAVATDHGMPANKKAVALVNAFKDRGWLAITADGRGVNWGQGGLFFSQNHLWINLQGREPTGTVPREEYKPLRAEVQRVMRDTTDPETGEHVFSFVLTREEAPMVGLWGDHIGDLVFCYAGGYRWAGEDVLTMGEDRIVFPCKGGNHGPMIPTYETEVGSVYALLVLAGDGVRKGIQERPSEKGVRGTVDVAPTLAYLLGIDPPAQSEGRVLREFLEGFDSERPERQLVATARDLVRRPRRTRRTQLKGDVTDEETP